MARPFWQGDLTWAHDDDPTPLYNKSKQRRYKPYSKRRSIKKYIPRPKSPLTPSYTYNIEWIKRVGKTYYDIALNDTSNKARFIFGLHFDRSDDGTFETTWDWELEGFDENIREKIQAGAKLTWATNVLSFAFMKERLLALEQRRAIGHRGQNVVPVYVSVHGYCF